MQVKKEMWDGRLYLATQYSMGVLTRQSAPARARRKKMTSEAKQKINRMQKKWVLMRTMCANFDPFGQDLFVYLGYEYEPTEQEASRAIADFHSKARRIWEKEDTPYKYIVVTETHGEDGEDKRLHHHLVLSGIRGKRMLPLIMELWGHGSVDVRTLRSSDSFLDTCSYLLKERKPKGKRAYNSSHNLKRPSEPMRCRVGESEKYETPPGVKILDSESRASEDGQYCIVVAQIIDVAAFEAYWKRRKEKNIIMNQWWRKYERRDKRHAATIRNT